MSSGLSYEHAQASWQSETLLTVVDVQGVTVATVPLDFLQQGGVNNWAFVHEVVHYCFVEESASPGVLVDANGLQPQGTPTAGVYTITWPSDPNSVPALAAAPTEYHAFVPAPAAFPSSPRTRRASRAYATPSSSTRSSTGRTLWGDSSLCDDEDCDLQTKFHVLIGRRDDRCVITDDEGCQAAHLVPIGRQDIYSRWFGDEAGKMIYDIRMGIFVRADLRLHFDSLLLGLYVEGSRARAVVHVFKKTLGSIAAYHGRPVSIDFTLESAPDVRAIRWHYRQCVLARLRGPFVPSNASIT